MDFDCGVGVGVGGIGFCVCFVFFTCVYISSKGEGRRHGEGGLNHSLRGKKKRKKERRESVRVSEECFRHDRVFSASSNQHANML